MSPNIPEPERPELRDTGDFRPNEYGEMRFDTLLVKKSEAFNEHPNIDLGHGGSYFYSGELPQVYRPNFKTQAIEKIPNQNLASIVANTYMQAAPFSQTK